MREVFYTLLGWGLAAGACVGAGRLLIARWKLPLHRQELAPVAFVLGAAVVSLLTFAMAAVHAIHKGTLLIAALAILAAAARSRASAPTLPATRAGWVMLAAVPAGVWTFLHALAPEMSADGMAYHLGLTARYYREHGFPFIPDNMYANLSQAMEMLFLFAFPFGRHSGAALMHWSFGAALAGLMFAHGRRFGFPYAGAAAAVLVAASPVVGIDAASAYNDVAAAAAIFTVYHLLRVWDETGDAGVLLAVGLAAGFAYAIKYTAFLALPFAIVWLVWRRASLRRLAVVAAMAAVSIAPWAAKNAIQLGNPVSPFFNKYFPNPYVHVSFEEQYRKDMRDYGVLDKRALPVEVTVRGHLTNGLLGPVFLLAPLALLALRHPHGAGLLAAAAVFALPYASNIGTRFLIPMLPFLSLALTVPLARRARTAAVFAAIHAIVCWPPVVNLYCAQYAWRLFEFPLEAALRIEPKHEFLTRLAGPYQVARMIEERTPPGAWILATNQVAEAYCTRRVSVVYQSAMGQNLGSLLYAPVVHDWVASRVVEFTVPAASISGVRVTQTGSSPEQWYVSELRIHAGGAELPRDPGWRFRASPMPWEAGEAFDNSPLTGWQSWQAARPGMFFEVRFAGPKAVDRVTIETPPVDRLLSLSLDVLGADGRTWRPSGAVPREIDGAAPLGLRGQAAGTLKRKGVTHILLHQADPQAPDVEKRLDDWGLRKLGERDGHRLYEIR